MSAYRRALSQYIARLRPMDRSFGQFEQDRWQL